MEIHNLVQGTPPWHTFRYDHDGASEAAAMLGLSNLTTRTELLHMKATGGVKEFSEWVQSRILDHGHVVEALARPLVEDLIYDALYPVTCSEGRMSASCDGLTLDEKSCAMEHKQWNERLAAQVASGEMPEEHMPQCQQVLMVTGAEKLIFVVSDGTLNNFAYIYVHPEPEWFDRIRAGWKQFHADVAAYEYVEMLPPVVAAPVKDLPALSIRINGELSLHHNLLVFGSQLNQFIADINTNPQDDQAFADAVAAVKVMERAETALGAAEASALGQIASVDDMVRTVATYKELAKKTRVMLERLVAARKETLRVEILQAAKDQCTAHMAALNVRLGKPYMPLVALDLIGAMKGKRTISSLRDAADTEIARFKIAANAVADGIQINLATLLELAGAHRFLFSDAAAIVQKDADDLRALVKLRIAEHDRIEAEKAEALRIQIIEDERARVAAVAETARLAQIETDRIAEVDRIAKETKAAETPLAAKIAKQVATSAQAPASRIDPMAHYGNSIQRDGDRDSARRSGRAMPAAIPVVPVQAELTMPAPGDAATKRAPAQQENYAAAQVEYEAVAQRHSHMKAVMDGMPEPSHIAILLLVMATYGMDRNSAVTCLARCDWELLRDPDFDEVAA